MKIGLVTIFAKNPNYGNKLQNYAGVRILTDMGFETETLVEEPQRDNLKIHIKRIINMLSGCRLSGAQHQLEKQDSFYQFDKKYLHPSYRLLKGKSLDKYDYFAVGSDQVWNPTWYMGMKKDAFWLTFARPEQKICMAPSIGLDELPDEWKGYFKEQLMTFPHLSVREESGARIIKELTGRDAEVVIDPTLMLDAADWRMIEKRSKARKNGKPYILKYFLGDQDADNANRIQNIADKNSFEVFELLDTANKDVFSAGPSEFIDLIDNAKLVCTDSFHACVFSILFDKPFLVFNRKGKYENLGSRITGLLKMLGLEDRLPGAVADDRVFEHDYREAYKRLEMERAKAYKFLKRSLNKE